MSRRQGLVAALGHEDGALGPLGAACYPQQVPRSWGSDTVSWGEARRPLAGRAVRLPGAEKGTLRCAFKTRIPKGGSPHACAHTRAHARLRPLHPCPAMAVLTVPGLRAGPRSTHVPQHGRGDSAARPPG